MALFRKNDDTSRSAPDGGNGRTGATSVAEREPARTPADGPSRTTAPATAPHPHDVHERERAEFGGMSWGAAFFGWLVAIGIAALLTAIVSAAGAATGLTDVSTAEATDAAGTVGIVGGILLLVILLIAYYAGGYVAGRMSRFDGARQGFGVWLIGLLVTIALAVAGVVLGAEYNVLEQLDLPRIPVDEGALTTGGLITLAAVIIGTLLAAISGGKVGTRFHRKVDRAGLADDTRRN
jgi:hypothetical protein